MCHIRAARVVLHLDRGIERRCPIPTDHTDHTTTDHRPRERAAARQPSARSAGIGDEMTSTRPPYPLPRRLPDEPPPELAELRADTPVVQVDVPALGPAWLVTRYEEVRQVISDPRFGPLFPGVRRESDPDGPDGDTSDPSDFLFVKDGAEHARLRRLVSGVFTARQVAGLRDRVVQLAVELVDRMAAGQRPADFVEAVAAPLPMAVISDLLGVPAADRTSFRAWSDAVLSVSAHTPEEVGQAAAELARYVAELVRAKREHPGSDLLSALIAARDEDQDRLTDRELHAMANTLLIAGYDPTVVALSRGLWVLLGDRDRYAMLAGDPARVPAAVEEILRHQAGDGDLMRVAKEDIQIDGTTIHCGQPVIASLPGANRDPGHFPDPDRFDMSRVDNPHLAFGHGPHYCLGAALSRLELQVVFDLLVRRLPGLRLAVEPAQVRWSSGLLTRGPTALPVTW